MLTDHHDLTKELPEFKDEITELQASDEQFRNIYTKYNDVNLEILRLEEGIDASSDFYLEDLKKKRLQQLDEITALLRSFRESKN